MNPRSAVDLCNAYVTQLHKAEVDKAFLLAHKKSLPKDEFDILLSNADRDIAFARSKLQRVTPFIQVPQLPEIKSEAMNVKMDVKPEAMEVTPEIIPPQTPENSSSDNSPWWLVGGVVAGLVATPFIINWVSKDPKNVQTLQDVLKSMSKASGYVYR